MSIPTTSHLDISMNFVDEYIPAAKLNDHRTWLHSTCNLLGIRFQYCYFGIGQIVS